MLRVFFHLCLFFVVVVGRLGGLFVCFEGFIVLFCFVFGDKVLPNNPGSPGIPNPLASQVPISLF
jgi:hypothetical protein